MLITSPLNIVCSLNFSTIPNLAIDQPESCSLSSHVGDKQSRAEVELLFLAVRVGIK